MVVSILHRITGNANAIVGLPILLWWLGALVSGPEAYATFARVMWPSLASLDWSGAGAILWSIVRLVPKLVLIGISLSVFTHMASGIRHFVLDLGAGYELGVNKIWSVLTPVIGVALAALFWALLLLR
jgi:succinate dehydrogenase / fumarate reductase, cytochrome b subunit